MDEAQKTNGEAEPSGPQPPIRVVIADSQAIFRVGVRKVLAVEDDIRVVAQAETMEQALVSIERHSADILLLEAGLGSSPADAISQINSKAPNLKIVLLASETDEQQTVEYLRRGVRGLLSHAVAPDLLVKCVRKIASGETWLDKRGINWVIEAYRSQSAQLTLARPNKARLSDKEMRIISCVSQGMKNKEIAVQIGTTEQVIKNYLRKIYDKLGVADRLELALYVIHHRLLEGGQPPAPGTEVDVFAEFATK